MGHIGHGQNGNATCDSDRDWKCGLDELDDTEQGELFWVLLRMLSCVQAWTVYMETDWERGLDGLDDTQQGELFWVFFLAYYMRSYSPWNEITH